MQRSCANHQGKSLPLGTQSRWTAGQSLRRVQVHRRSGFPRAVPLQVSNRQVPDSYLPPQHQRRTDLSVDARGKGVASQQKSERNHRNHFGNAGPSRRHQCNQPGGCEPSQARRFFWGGSGEGCQRCHEMILDLPKTESTLLSFQILTLFKE